MPGGNEGVELQADAPAERLRLLEPNHFIQVVTV